MIDYLIIVCYIHSLIHVFIFFKHRFDNQPRSSGSLLLIAVQQSKCFKKSQFNVSKKFLSMAVS